MTEVYLGRLLRLSILASLITATPAFSGRIVQFQPPPQQLPPPVMPTPNPTPNPTPPNRGPMNQPSGVGEMEFAITPFSNMEHGWHIFEPGYRAVLMDNGGVVATAKLSIDAAINGETTDGAGAYQGLIIRPLVQYVRPGATGGNAELSICLDRNSEQPDAPANCQQVTSVTRGDQERAISFRGQANYRIGGDSNRGYTVSVQAGAPGLSAWHPAFGFAAPGKAFKDYQSPIVLDMNGDGKLALTDVWDNKSLVRFDMALEGRAFPTGWVKPSDAFLAIDSNGNGKIDNASELFGEYTGAEVLGPKTFKNGFEALAKYDSNKDGIVDAKDKDFGKIMLWFDRNQNGRTDKGELVSLASQGITVLKLESKELRDEYGNYPVVARNEVRIMGSFVRNGKEFQMADVWFKVRRNYDQATAMTKWLMAPVK